MSLPWRGDVQENIKISRPKTISRKTYPEEMLPGSIVTLSAGKSLCQILFKTSSSVVGHTYLNWFLHLGL